MSSNTSDPPPTVLSSSTASLIKPKNSLDDHIKINTLKNEIVLMITKIPNYQILKNDIELIEYVATQIKNLIKTPNYDLTTIIVEIFTNVFSLSNDEQTALKKVIEYLINNKTIQKISKLTKLSNSVYSVVKKKIL
jgi:hypothetical protein